MADLGDQLRLNLEINNLIVARNELITRQNALVLQQIDLQRLLCEALECQFDEEMAERMRDISVEMRKAIEETHNYAKANEDLGKRMREIAEATEKSSQKMQEWKVKARAAAYGAAAFKATQFVFKRLSSILEGLLSMVQAVFKAASNMAIFIISLPFQINKSLIKTANDLMVISEVALALEETRKQFGDLGTSTGALIKDSFRPMRTEFNKLAASGHSFAKTFGFGREGLANAIKLNNELFGALKGGTYALRAEIAKPINIAQLAIYRKGLGLTAEQQANLIHMSNQQGKSATAVQEEMAKYAIGLGDRFGFSAKEIGMSMAEMTMDVKNFGTMGQKQIGALAVYTKKLGIETKQLQGVIDKYDNFEEAAKSASMLNQTFGMQIDVIKMMRNEDPGKRLRMLQDSFMATGRSYDSLSRIERKRLAELAGLDDAAARAAFSQSGLSMSYDEIVAASDNVEGSSKSLDSTMKGLSTNMERILQLGRKFESFFQAFISGVTFGLIHLGGARKLFTNISQSMRIVYRDGIELGGKLPKAFEPLGDIIKGLTEFYDPEKFRENSGKLLGALLRFFGAAKGTPTQLKEAFENLWGELGEISGGLFATNGPLRRGLRDFAMFFGNTMLNLATEIVKNMTKIFRVISKVFDAKNPMGLGAALRSEFGGEAGMLGTAFEGLLGEGGTLDGMFGQAFDGLVAALIDAKDPLVNAATNVFNAITAVITPLLSDAFVAAVDHAIPLMWKTFKKADFLGQMVMLQQTGFLDALGSVLAAGAGIIVQRMMMKSAITSALAGTAATTAATTVGGGATTGLLGGLVAGAAALGPAGWAAIAVAAGAAVLYGFWRYASSKETDEEIELAVKGLQAGYKEDAIAYAQEKMKSDKSFLGGTLDKYYKKDENFEKYVREFYTKQQMSPEDVEKEVANAKRRAGLDKIHRDMQDKMAELQAVNIIEGTAKAFIGVEERLNKAKASIPQGEALHRMRESIQGYVTALKAAVEVVNQEIQLLSGTLAQGVSDNKTRVVLLNDGINGIISSINGIKKFDEGFDIKERLTTFATQFRNFKDGLIAFESNNKDVLEYFNGSADQNVESVIDLMVPARERLSKMVARQQNIKKYLDSFVGMFTEFIQQMPEFNHVPFTEGQEVHTYLTNLYTAAESLGTQFYNFSQQRGFKHIDDIDKSITTERADKFDDMVSAALKMKDATMKLDGFDTAKAESSSKGMEAFETLWDGVKKNIVQNKFLAPFKTEEFAAIAKNRDNVVKTSNAINEILGWAQSTQTLLKSVSDFGSSNAGIKSNMEGSLSTMSGALDTLNVWIKKDFLPEQNKFNTSNMNAQTKIKDLEGILNNLNLLLFEFKSFKFEQSDAMSYATSIEKMKGAIWGAWSLLYEVPKNADMMTSPAKRVIDHVFEIEKAMANIKKETVVLDRFNKANDLLEGSKGQIVVKHENFQVKLDLHVKLDAKDVFDAIVEVKETTKFSNNMLSNGTVSQFATSVEQ